MTDTLLLTPPALAPALGVPDEAFRAFARLRGVAWEARLSCAAAEPRRAFQASRRRPITCFPRGRSWPA